MALFELTLWWYLHHNPYFNVLGEKGAILCGGLSFFDTQISMSKAKVLEPTASAKKKHTKVKPIAFLPIDRMRKAKASNPICFNSPYSESDPFLIVTPAKQWVL